MHEMTRPVVPEVRLVRLAAAGDHAAFEELVRAHGDAMARVAFAMSGDTELARDAVQAAWVLAWERLEQLRSPDRLRSWLLTLVSNETKRVLRRNAGRRRLETEVAIQALASVNDPAPDIDLREALSTLSVKQRELLGLRYGAGLRSHEIGFHFGTRASTIRVRLSRTLAQLRKELDGE